MENWMVNCALRDIGSLTAEVDGQIILFQTYGPLKDAGSGQPLFNCNAWKAAQGIL